MTVTARRNHPGPGGIAFAFFRSWEYRITFGNCTRHRAATCPERASCPKGRLAGRSGHRPPLADLGVRVIPHLGSGPVGQVERQNGRCAAGGRKRWKRSLHRTSDPQKKRHKNFRHCTVMWQAGEAVSRAVDSSSRESAGGAKPCGLTPQGRRPTPRAAADLQPAVQKTRPVTSGPDIRSY